MKILQVIPVFSDIFGGPVSVVRSLSKELAKRHEVTIYTTTALDLKHDIEPKEEVRNNYRVIYFPRTFQSLNYSYLFGQLNFSLSMMNAVKKNLTNFDIIHLHSYRQFPDLLVHYYATKYNVPYILQAHGSLPRMMTKQSLKWIYDELFGYKLLKDAAKIIALNTVEFEQYRDFSVPTDKIVIVPNGIDLSDFTNMPEKGEFKKKYGLNEDEKIILYLGRIHKIKGIDILIKAFKEVIDTLDCVKLVLVGPDDGYLNEIKDLIKKLGLEKNIIITGALFGKEKFMAYVDADIFVLPSRYEIFPVSVLEAFSCGIPVIASNVGGLRGLILDGETGLLFESENIEQLANNILSLINDKEKNRIISINGKQFINDNLSIERVTEVLENCYKEIIKSN